MTCHATAIEKSAAGQINGCCPTRSDAAAETAIRGDAWSYRPDADIIDAGREYQIVLDVPGAGPDQLEITVENGSLEIRATAAPRVPATARVLRSEYGVGDYFHRFQLSDQIDVQNITASCAAGVLIMTLPKVQAAQPRQIKVKVNGAS